MQLARQPLAFLESCLILDSADQAEAFGGGSRQPGNGMEESNCGLGRPTSRWEVDGQRANRPIAGHHRNRDYELPGNFADDRMRSREPTVAEDLGWQILINDISSPPNCLERRSLTAGLGGSIHGFDVAG